VGPAEGLSDGRPNYAKARSDLAKQMGLGQGGRQAPRKKR
jgi:predicted transcriptional regulator